MGNENLAKLINFLAVDKEARDKVKSIGGDADALSAYVKELGYDISVQELHEYREQTYKQLESKLKKAQEKKAAQTPGVQAFYGLMALAETDKEVEKRLEELGDSTTSELVAYGKEKGFIFDEQDLDTVGNDVLDPSEELSDEELELVAGGTTIVASAFIIVAVIAFIGIGAAVVKAVTSQHFG